nr:Uma2 family endonuclease [Trichocoleus sp. FACHB-591]
MAGDRKAKVCNQDNIPEYWVVDGKQQLIVFREAQEGTYQVEQV